MTRFDIFRILFVLSGAIAQVAFGALPFVLGWEETVASRSNAAQTLLTPASYAFSIWSLIFAANFLFALYHAVRPSNALMRSVGWFAGAAFWFNSAWETYAPLIGFDAGALAIIFLGWISAVVFVLRAGADRETGLAGRLILFGLFLLGGWLNAAAFVHIALTSEQLGWPVLGAGDLQAALIILAAAVLIAAGLVWRTGSLSYAAALSWGLYAIHVGNADSGDAILTNAPLAGIGLLGLALIAGWLRLRRSNAS
jgi:hypothetical protein